MATPSEPNFDKNKEIRSRIVLDRHDFQKHIDGSDFFQEASSIILDPVIDISGNQSNVRGAILALKDSILSGAPDATSSTKGILRLTNDFGGTSNAPLVTGIQGRPVQTLGSINDGDYLAWNSAGYFEPITPAITSFVAGQDLAGTTTNQTVIELTGELESSGGFNGNVVDINARYLRFANDIASDVSITFANNPSGNGSYLNLQAQNSLTNGNGGGVNIQSGLGGIGSYKDGYISLNKGSVTYFQINEPEVDRTVISLGSENSTSNMPTGTGDVVLYISNASANPSSGSPVGGAILYSSGGSLYTKRQSGLNFQIGDAQRIGGYDVAISNIGDGYALIYDSGSGDWVAEPLSGAFSAGGDLSGTSTSQQVIAIDGYQVDMSIPPTSGKALVYNGSAWVPTTISTIFSADTDLAGTEISQTVVGITGFLSGSEYHVNVGADAFKFDGYHETSNDVSLEVLDGYGRGLSISAGNGGTNQNGGTLSLISGDGNGTGIDGYVSINNALRVSKEESTIIINDTVSSVSTPVGGNTLYSIPNELMVKSSNNVLHSLFVKKGTVNLDGYVAFGSVSINEVVSTDITISGATETSDIYVRFNDPSEVVRAFIIQGWAYVSSDTVRVYFVSIDGIMPPTNFDLLWELRYR